MNIEVIISTMNNSNILELVEKMNIQTKAIVINQSDNHDYKEFSFNNNIIRSYSFNEIGVGKSRNSGLSRSTETICLMADDDMVYVNNYDQIILEEFKNNPSADVILFNVPIYNQDGTKIIKIKKNEKINIFNSLKYGTVNIAFRRNTIIKNNIHFSLFFGGGTFFGSGEDTLFINECLKKNLKVISNTKVIATIKQGQSTWFSGYNEKFFMDKGALFKALSPALYHLYIVQFVLRKRSLYKKEYNFLEILKLMYDGARKFKKFEVME